MKKIQNIRLNKLKLRIALILLSGTVALGGLAYFIASLIIKSKAEKKYDIKNVITQEAENTYFDDFILEDFEKELIDLQKYIEISNELEKLIGKKYTIEDESLKYQLLKSPEEIRELIEKYKTNKKDVEVLKELKVQASLANIYLKTDGYDILSNALLYALKIEIVDAYGFDKELSNNLLTSIVIPSFNGMNMDEDDPNLHSDSVKIGENEVTLSDDLIELLKQIYDLQHADGKENEKGYGYFDERNNMLEDSFDYLKAVLEKDSEFEQLKIK